MTSGEAVINSSHSQKRFERPKLKVINLKKRQPPTEYFAPSAVFLFFILPLFGSIFSCSFPFYGISGTLIFSM